MICTDFCFAGKYLSDLGYLICDFNGGETNWSGGEVTFTTIKPPDSDRHTFYTSSMETPLSCAISICKNPCMLKDEEMIISHEDMSVIMRWLKRTDGYYWLKFVTDDMEDTYYHSQIEVVPHYFKNDIIGFDLTINTDSPYGWSDLITREFILSNSSPIYTMKNYSDKTGRIYPKTTITIMNSGANDTLSFSCGLDGNMTNVKIKNCNKNDVIVLDKDNDYFSGISNPNNFNFYFPYIENDYDDIKTCFKLENNSVQCKIKIEYRLVRMVVV